MKIGHSFTDQNLINMNDTNNGVIKGCSLSLVFKYKNHFQDDEVDSWPKIWALKS